MKRKTAEEKDDDFDSSDDNDDDGENDEDEDDEDNDSDEESEEELVKTLASTRSHRANAGRRMNQLLEQMDEDEVYKELYGGFQEVANDAEYSTEEEEEDQVDSDFDEPEPDPGEDDEEAVIADVVIRQEELTERRKKLVYKDPQLAKKRARRNIENAEANDEHNDNRLKKKSVASSSPSQPPSTSASTMAVKRVRVKKVYGDTPHVMSKRKVTVDRSVLTREKEEERSQKKKEVKKRTPEKQMTQKERLKEAKITEQLNRANVEAFLKMEADKQKVPVVARKQYHGPVISFVSMREKQRNGTFVERTLINFRNCENWKEVLCPTVIEK